MVQPGKGHEDLLASFARDSDAIIIDLTDSSVIVQAPGGYPMGTTVPVVVQTCDHFTFWPEGFTYTGGLPCSPPPVLERIAQVVDYCVRCEDARWIEARVGEARGKKFRSGECRRR